MSEESKKQPFKRLGEQLKTIRQKKHETMSEVSGAVEIDEKALARIEQGDERPGEDILLLLISHFGIKDDEAAGLWQLAGYEQPKPDSDAGHDDSLGGNNRAMVMIMAVDPRIMFSDGVQVTANHNGVIMNFTQATGTPQSMTIARIGMSREQAYSVIQVLGRALAGSEPKLLPHTLPKSTKVSKSKSPKKQQKDN